MSVAWDRHFVIQPPAPFAFLAEKIVNQALHDLAPGPEFPANGIFKLLLPLWPAVFFSHWRRCFQQFTASGQCRSEIRTQLARESGDRIFNVNLSAVDCFCAEEIGEILENIFADHDVDPPLRLSGTLFCRKPGCAPNERPPGDCLYRNPTSCAA